MNHFSTLLNILKNKFLYPAPLALFITIISVYISFKYIELETYLLSWFSFLSNFIGLSDSFYIKNLFVLFPCKYFFLSFIIIPFVIIYLLSFFYLPITINLTVFMYLYFKGNISNFFQSKETVISDPIFSFIMKKLEKARVVLRLLPTTVCRSNSAEETFFIYPASQEAVRKESEGKISPGHAVMANFVFVNTDNLSEISFYKISGSFLYKSFFFSSYKSINVPTKIFLHSPKRSFIKSTTELCRTTNIYKISSRTMIRGVSNLITKPCRVTYQLPLYNVIKLHYPDQGYTGCKVKSTLSGKDLNTGLNIYESKVVAAHGEELPNGQFKLQKIRLFMLSILSFVKKSIFIFNLVKDAIIYDKPYIFNVSNILYLVSKDVRGKFSIKAYSYALNQRKDEQHLKVFSRITTNKIVMLLTYNANINLILYLNNSLGVFLFNTNYFFNIFRFK